MAKHIAVTMDAFEIHGEKHGPVVSLQPSNVHRLRLCRDSRFAPHQLSVHLATCPDLAYRSSANDEYIVGGSWRRRREIGAILETSCAGLCVELMVALLDAYRRNDTALVVADPREQERSESHYRRCGFEPVQTLVQLERASTEPAAVRQSSAIRAMREKDVEPVLMVERNAFPWLWWNSKAELLWYAGILGVELHVTTAREQPRRIVGYAGFTVLDRKGHLDRLAVHRDFQGQGYGAALLAFSIDRMVSLGVRRLALTTQLDNLRSQALYQRFGFVQSAWSHEILGKWLRAPRPEETT